MKVWPGTSVKEKELAEIKLLKVEEALSAESIGIIDELNENIPSLRSSILLTSRRLLGHFGFKSQRLESSQDETIQILSNVISNLEIKKNKKNKTGKNILNQAINNISRIIRISKEVVRIIRNIEINETQKKFSFPQRGKKIIEKIIQLQGKERRQMQAKLHVLYIATNHLTEFRQLLNELINNLKSAKRDLSSKNRSIVNIANSLIFAASNLLNLKSSIVSIKSILKLYSSYLSIWNEMSEATVILEHNFEYQAQIYGLKF